MRPIRVLRLYHSAVVPEFQERERRLRDDYGWDVHVVAPREWHEGGRTVRAATQSGVPLHIVPAHGRRHPILFWYDGRALRRVLREVRPALLDLHEEPYSLAARTALHHARAVVGRMPVCIYTAQNIYKRYPLPFSRLERSMLAAAAAAYPCSTEAGEVLRRKGFRGSVHVIPLGVAIPPRGLERTSEQAVVGFVGRLVPEKGVDVAIQAFAQLAGVVKARFSVVGAGPDQERLRALAAQLGVADRVDFVGAVPQSEALERIRSFAVLVVPSRTTPRWKEQFGRVVAQALAVGTPVVASDSGSLPEVLDGCGLIAREGDADDLADKLRALLLDPDLLQEFAKRGRGRAESEFSWERVAGRMDAMYRELLDHG